jgi:hypothetical protein
LALQLNPIVAAPPVLSGLTCVNTSLTAAGIDTCTVSLQNVAASDVTVNLTSDNAAVVVPVSVTIPAGSSNSGFVGTYSAVSSLQTANLTASFSGISQTLTLQLNPLVANLDVSSLVLDFSTVNVDGTYSQPLIVSSTGTAPVSIDSITITGQGFSVPDAIIPMTLNPGQSATLMVQLNPNASGKVNGELTLNTSSPAPSIMSSGHLTSSSSPSTMGNQLAVNASSSTSTNSKKVKLTGNAIPLVKKLSCANASITAGNSTGCSVTLNSAAATGGLAVGLASNSNAVGVPASVMVPAGATGVSFIATSSAINSSQTAILTASTATSAQSFSLVLNAPVSTLGVSANSLAFSGTAVNSTASQTLTLSSTGTAAVTINGVAVTGSGFEVSGAAFPMTLNSGQTATLTIQFTPSAAGTSTGQIAISSDSSSGSSSVVSLSGSGVPVLTGISCAETSITGAATDSCTVSINAAAATGGFVVNLGSNNSAVVGPTSVTVPTGSVSIGFTVNISTISTSQTALLTASSNGVTQSFSLQLNPIVATLTANSTTISFGNVNLNTPTVQSVTLTSTGTAPVAITAISITGTGFTVSGASFPLTLNPNQSVVLNITFNPTAVGLVTGQLTITSNASPGSSTLISLSGTGQSASHEVDLSWSAPTSSPDPVVGYIVSRAPVGNSNYQQLNASAVTQTNYVDNTVQSGQSYNYVVESVGTSGNISVPSNVASAVIP